MARAPAPRNNQSTLPPVLQGLMSSPAQVPTMRAGAGLSGAMPTLTGPTQQMPSYQVGGMVGPQGQPVRPAGLQDSAPQSPMSADVVEAQIQDLASRNPQVLAQIRQAIAEAIMSGELTQQELNMMVQLATTVLRNPALYPQIRQFAIQQGLATEQDLSPTYDQGLVVAVLIAARAAQSDVGGQNMMAGGTPAMAGAAPMQSLKNGGQVRGQSSEPVVIQAHTGEYVVPKHVVEMKGREFFDRMLEQYADKAGNE